MFLEKFLSVYPLEVVGRGNETTAPVGHILFGELEGKQGIGLHIVESISRDVYCLFHGVCLVSEHHTLPNAVVKLSQRRINPSYQWHTCH